MKPVSGWSSILIENGESGEEIQFYPDLLKARHSGLSYAMNTVDAFHTYRVLIIGDAFRVYVDGELKIDGAGRFTHPANGRSGISFGGANSPSLGGAYWESVRIHNRAQTLTDLVLSVRMDQ